MSNFFGRRGAAFKNEMNRSLGALVGIAQGMLCDQQLSDDEIRFLDRWLTENDAISAIWPGDVIHQRIRAALEDGIITNEERDHLVTTLQQLIGGALDDLEASTHVTELAFDDVPGIEFQEYRFCLTGDFVFGPRTVCKRAIEQRGGTVGGVTKKTRYLIVGGLGSTEWKHGSFGTKLEKAMRYKNDGVPILIVHEDQWVGSL